MLVVPSRQLLLFGRSAGLGFDQNWWKRWQAGGINPSVVLDFEHGLYYDGATSQAAVLEMIGGSPTIDTTGLLCNSTSITGIGQLLAALQGGAFSLQLQTIGGTASVNAGVISTNLTDGPFTQDAGNTVDSFVNSGSFSLIGPALDWTSRNFLFMSTSTGGNARNLAAIGSTGAIGTANDAHPFASNPSTMQIGSYNGSLAFGGHFLSLAAVNNVWGTQAAAMPAFTGTNGIFCGGNANGNVNYGNVLEYEYTQPWTVIAAVCVHDTGSSGGVIFSNVAAGPAFPGYELWYDTSGFLRIRVIHDISANLYLGTIGSTNLADKKWHVVAGTYDGSGRVAGCKLYVDGVAESQSTEIDALGGNTIIAGNNYYIANQTGGGFGISGGLGLFRQYNVVKPLSFIQSFKLNQTLPAIDGTCVLAPKLSEGGSNTTTADASASGLTGTLSSTALWLRG